ncbi:Uncharacterized protein conserved in bacteria [Escherichia coli]|uniref:Uncharacterized protein conserved in bacteria n=13 Tax=Enterobacteriaceae TaxID=543 RepID=A0A447X979_ECOLX|nr:Uncharacterized protein conserved in bacteria [Escherichia coli]
MPMEFEWDENKAKSNRVKHGIRFEDAVLLFDDPQHLSQQERIENGEYRWQTIGLVYGIVVILVAHTIRFESGNELFESSVHEKQIVKRGIAMSMVKHKRGTSSTLDVQHEAELKALTNKSDEDIDYSDIPPSSDEQWSNAERGKFYRPLKTQASVRIDADVMEWLKRPGKGYQTRLNAILREAMLRDQNKK